MLCCSGPPEGAARWTLRLQADRLVELGLLESITPAAIHGRLKNELTLLEPQALAGEAAVPKHALGPVRRQDGEVLAVYQRPYDPKRPVVCLDEKSKELHPTPRCRRSLRHRAGKTRREDSEYQRSGTRNLFLWVEPLARRRAVCVTELCTVLDFAAQLQRLVAASPEAERVVLVTDNLTPLKP